MMGVQTAIVIDSKGRPDLSISRLQAPQRLTVSRGVWRPSTARFSVPRASTAQAKPPASGGSKPSANKPIDVLALSNLCVDVIFNVKALPAPDKAAKKAFVEELLKSDPPGEEALEAGGSANFAIASARLGLRTECLGHLGARDEYAPFMRRVLADEGVKYTPLLAPGSPASDTATLICYVMVDQNHRHAFSSRFDSTTEPSLVALGSLPPAAAARLSACKAIFLNGFCFDELPPAIIIEAVAVAKAAGAAVFFDAGPRYPVLQANSPPGAAAALPKLLSMATVLLCTNDEAALMTGHQSPDEAADALLKAHPGVEQVALKLGHLGCLIKTRGGTICKLPGLNVAVSDTVGCGDSFAAGVVLGYLLPGATLPATAGLANAVGAATAMSRGAGRNVAKAGVVAALLRAQVTETDKAADRDSAAGALDLLARAKAAAAAAQ